MVGRQAQSREDERGLLSACEKIPTVSSHLRRSSVMGAFEPGGALRGLTRRRAAQPCLVHSLLVQEEADAGSHRVDSGAIV